MIGLLTDAEGEPPAVRVFPGNTADPAGLTEPILEELERIRVSPDYWNYVRSRMERMEKLWVRNHPGEDPPDDRKRLPKSRPE